MIVSKVTEYIGEVVCTFITDVLFVKTSSFGKPLSLKYYASVINCPFIEICRLK